ncbi:MAG: protein kinase [Acidobacteriota bacterium]
MKPERWKQVDELVQAALDRDEDKRAAFINEACKGDDVLRREVESLLAYHEQVSGFLESPAIEQAAELIAPSLTPLLEGRTISHYRLDRLIAHGGMGAVYLAHDSSLDRQVAIKFLSDLTADELARKRLVREARAAARLDHPNICSVYEVAEREGLTFIVMQHVEGETLSERIHRKPMEISEVLDVAVQVADALAEAHSHAVIHRDIKPANIMLTARGQVKVLDFGLAKIVRREDVAGSEIATESLMSEPGVIAGTVPYMSPEQLRAEAIDSRSDIFSFGVVLYEMISGNQPFESGSAAETISAILTREPPSLARYSTELPPEMERIVSKSLRKDREQRYQTARDLLIDLNDLKHKLEFEQELERSLPHDSGEGGTRPVVTTAGESVDTAGLAAAQTATTAAYVGGALKRHRRGLIIAAATLVLAAAALIYLFYFPAGGKALDSIAVLPLVNAGNDPETEYLSDGITESLINSLTQVQQLRKVVARTTVFRYKGKEIDPRQVGRDLGVEAILTGRLIPQGDNLTIQVDLVETSEGSQVWGEHYDRKASDLLAVRQELAREITERLRLRLSGEDEKRLTKGSTNNTEAHMLYLKGRHFWNRRTGANIKKAIEQFQQAIDKDPNYALAHVGLADCYVLLEERADNPATETLPKARAAAQRALQIDDSLAEAHASLGQIERHSWNFREAEREFRRAIELNPNYPTAHHWYSVYLRMVRGRFDEAMAEIRRAQQLDPLSPVISNNLAIIHLMKGELDAAIEEAKKVLELEPNFAPAHRLLGFLYRRQGRYEEAIAELEKAVEFSGRRSLELATLGVCYAVAGKKAEARAILKEIEEKYDRREALGQNLARMYAVLGDKERAFTCLEKDFQARSGLLLNIAYLPEGDILRDKLSGDPRWNDLLRRIGFPQN